MKLELEFREKVIVIIWYLTVCGVGVGDDSEDLCLDFAEAILWDFCTYTVQYLPENAGQVRKSQ